MVKSRGGLALWRCYFLIVTSDIQRSADLSCVLNYRFLQPRLMMILCVWSIVFTSIYHQGSATDEDGFVEGQHCVVSWPTACLYDETFDHFLSSAHKIAIVFRQQNWGSQGWNCGHTGSCRSGPWLRSFGRQCCTFCTSMSLVKPCRLLKRGYVMLCHAMPCFIQIESLFGNLSKSAPKPWIFVEQIEQIGLSQDSRPDSDLEVFADYHGHFTGWSNVLLQHDSSKCWSQESDLRVIVSKRIQRFKDWIFWENLLRVHWGGELIMLGVFIVCCQVFL